MSNLTEFVNVMASGYCYQGTCSPVGGLQGTLGAPEIIGIVGILVMFFIGMKMKVSADLLIVSVLTMIFIVTSTAIGVAYLPQWVEWLFVLPGAVIFAMGMIKVLKHR